MGDRRRNLFILLFVLGLLAASLAVIAAKPTRLGLDLRGGTELVYQGRPTPQTPTVTSDDIKRSIEIIRQRTDKLGVAEPEIAQVGADQISVGLPDVQNADRAIAQVGTTAQLYFYDWEPNVIAKDGVSNPTESPFPRLFDAVEFASTQPPECKGCTSGEHYYLFGQRSQQLIAGPETDKADLLVDQPEQKMPAGSEVLTVPQGTLVVRAEKNSSGDPDRWYVIHDRPALSGTDLKDPQPNTDNSGAIVTFSFGGDGRQKFQDVTRAIAQRGLAKAVPGVPSAQQSGHFAVVLDNEIVSRPIIDYGENPDGIDGRTGAQISGLDSIQEANDLAEFLKIGALPIDLKLISQSTVSATLGQQALDQGLKAGLIGLALILVFLLLYYRFLGFVAGVGLIVYAIFFFALVKLIPITLTLPGIAGLILTIGVAADANIIIFERIKEEARAGKSMASAIATGYRKGIATIVDANVITLITAFILFVLATAGVKGFAFVLGVGTIVSLFTAVVFTQAFLGLFGRSRFLRSGKLLGATTEERVRWHFDFMGASRWFFSISGVIIAVGAIAFSTKQLNLGIDFQSGTRIKASLVKDPSVDEVRKALDSAGAGGAEVQQVTDDNFGDNVVQIQSDLEPEAIPKVQRSLQDNFGLEQDGFDSQSIGPTFGSQVATNAYRALIFSLLVIAGYVAFRFEPKYAVPVLIAVVHDVLITGGVYSLTGREVTSGTVAAFLTILGYSLYDTVIVFDRVRENVPRLPRAAFSQIVNRSMSEVLTRSLITGLSTVFLVGVLLFFGGATLKDFAFAMMIGILSGTYSSIFIASPVLTAWKEREPVYRRRRDRIASQMGRVPAFPEENLVARVDDGSPGEGEDQGWAAGAAGDGPPPSKEPRLGGAPCPAASLPAATPASALPTAAEPGPTQPAVEPSAPPVSEPIGNGEAEKPELSEASAAALERMRAERGGKRSGKRKRKHGRPR
ncbi:MAG: protein translocase subunit SecD [Solirubrobacterales bacterium]